jgi:hypothetical protein
MANESAPVWKRASETDRTRAIIIDRLKLVQELGREAKDAFVAQLGCNNLVSSISGPGLGDALEAEAKSRWCQAVLKRMSREPMLAVLQAEVELLHTRVDALKFTHTSEATRALTRRSCYAAYRDLYLLFMGFYLPRLETVMAAENIADSPWNGA